MGHVVAILVDVSSAQYSCHAYICGAGFKKADAAKITGADDATCCDPACDTHSCTAGVKKADAATLAGTDDATCCDIPLCDDLDIGVSNIYGDDCANYANEKLLCELMDDSDFTANELCCACGGGTADSTVEIRAPPSSAESDVAAREIANSISSLLANSLGLSEDELAAQKLFLVRGLAKTVSNAAITYGTSVLEFSAATQLQVIRVAAALTEVPVSEDELDLLLGAADTMFGASYTQFADDNVATIALDVTSSLLTVIQSSTDNTNTSQLKKRGQQVSRIVKALHIPWLLLYHLELRKYLHRSPYLLVCTQMLPLISNLTHSELISSCRMTCLTTLQKS